MKSLAKVEDPTDAGPRRRLARRLRKVRKIAHVGPPIPAGHVAENTSEIVVERINKSFGDHQVLNDVSFAVESGEMLAIVGESGCGKSVLLDIVTGMIKPHSGRILVADHSRPGSPLVDFLALDENDTVPIRLHWGEVFQRNALFGGTVYENVALWFRNHTDLPESEIRDRVRKSLTAVNLDVDDVIDKPRQSLSGGMAKRVAIARAIAIEPIVIFYDEPTSGLDPMSSGIIHDLIWKIHTHTEMLQHPRTSLIITHDRELLRRIAPRVLMLHDSKVCFDGKFEDFERSSDPNVCRYLKSMPMLNARIRYS